MKRLALAWAMATFFLIGILGFGPFASPSRLTRAKSANRPHVVLIDGGLLEPRSGILNIEAAPPISKIPLVASHGGQMVDTMIKQLIELRANPINAQMIVFGGTSSVSPQIARAAEVGPKVIVMALSGPSPSEAERAALSYANAKRILVLVAAGNDGWSEPGYPAKYAAEFDCVVSVSTTELGHKVLGANAGEVYLPRQSDERGTSYSAARAGAVAIAYLQHNPMATCKDAKDGLIRAFGHP